MNTDEGGAVEDGGGERGKAGIFPSVERGRRTAEERSEGKAEEGFAAYASEDGVAEGKKLGLAGEERVVFSETLAEAVAWIDDDGSGRNASGTGGPEACGEAVVDECEERIGRKLGLSAPLVRTAASVGEHDAGMKIGANGGECGIPLQSAYVVDDFRTGGESGARRRGLVSIN